MLSDLQTFMFFENYSNLHAFTLLSYHSDLHASMPHAFMLQCLMSWCFDVSCLQHIFILYSFNMMLMLNL